MNLQDTQNRCMSQPIAHQKCVICISLSAICWLGVFSTEVPTCRGSVSFPDYIPIAPAQCGLRTYECTYGFTGQYTSWIGGTKAVHYGDGTSLTGVEVINNTGPGTSILLYNDGTVVRCLEDGGWYLSTDSILTSYPAAVWSFGSVVDGTVIDQRPFYFVKEDLSESKLIDYQMLLVKIQDVSTLTGTYSDCVIHWTLDTRYPFTPLDLASKRPDLGLTLPTALDTQGYSVTDFSVFGFNVGTVAWGNIYAPSGTLQYVVELKEVAAIPAPAAILLGALGAGLVGWLRRHRAV